MTNLAQAPEIITRPKVSSNHVYSTGLNSERRGQGHSWATLARRGHRKKLSATREQKAEGQWSERQEEAPRTELSHGQTLRGPGCRRQWTCTLRTRVPGEVGTRMLHQWKPEEMLKGMSSCVSGIIQIASSSWLRVEGTHVRDPLRSAPAHGEGCRDACFATGASGRRDRPCGGRGSGWVLKVMSPPILTSTCSLGSMLLQ